MFLNQIVSAQGHTGLHSVLAKFDFPRSALYRAGVGYAFFLCPMTSDLTQLCGLSAAFIPHPGHDKLQHGSALLSKGRCQLQIERCETQKE